MPDPKPKATHPWRNSGKGYTEPKGDLTEEDFEKIKLRRGITESLDDQDKFFRERQEDIDAGPE